MEHLCENREARSERAAGLASIRHPRRATMLINAECKVVDDPFGLERSLWERMEP